MTHSSVLPSAIAAEVEIDPAVVALAMNAPRKIAGHAGSPRNRTTASAKPVGGQIGLALGCSEARLKPSFARMRYAKPMARSSKPYLASRLRPALRRVPARGSYRFRLIIRR